MGRLRVGFLLFLATTGAALAAEGRIPLFEPTTLDGTLGDISGSYVVTRNLTSDSGHVLLILGTGVETIEIDLNGFTLTGSSPTFDAVLGFSLRRLTIRNGSISTANSGAFSIFFSGTKIVDDEIVMENLRLVGDVATNNMSNFSVRNNTMIDSLLQITTTDGAPHTGLVADNLFRTELGTGEGISISGPGNNVVVRDNRVHLSGAIGIVVGEASGLRIERNEITGGGGPASHLTGILAGHDTEGCRITDNVVTNIGGVGISVTSSNGCLVTDNVVRGCSTIGMQLVDSDNNHVERNLVTGNGSFGLLFDVDSSGNAFGRNTVRGNAPDFADFGTGNTSFGDNLLPGPPPG